MEQEDLKNIENGLLIAKEEPIKEEFEAGYTETPTHYFRICARSDSGFVGGSMNQRYIHFSRQRSKINPEIYEVTIGSTEAPEWFNQPTFDTKAQAQDFINHISNANTKRDLSSFVFNIRSSLPRADSTIGNNEALRDNSKRHLVLTTCGPAYIHEYSKNYDPNYDVDKAFKDNPVTIRSNPDVFLESAESDSIEIIENFIEDIYDLRKTSLANEGEYSLGNLVFKEMRNRGYLDNLKDLKNKIRTKELSLTESTEAGFKLKKFADLTDIDKEKLIGAIQDLSAEYMWSDTELDDYFENCGFEYDGILIRDIFTDETCSSEFSFKEAVEYYGEENIENYINTFIDVFKDILIDKTDFDPYVDDTKISGEDTLLENNVKVLPDIKEVCNEPKITENLDIPTTITIDDFEEIFEVLSDGLIGDGTITDISYKGLDKNGNPYCEATIETVVDANDCDEEDFYDDEFRMFRGTCSDIDAYLSTSDGIYSAEEFELKHDFKVKFYDSECIDDDIDMVGEYSAEVLYPVDSAHEAEYQKAEGFVTIGTQLTITMLLHKGE